MNFERLLLIREKYGLTQKDVANILNVKQVNISNWENNKETISLVKLNLFANYFNTSFDYIIGLSNEKNFTPTSFLLNKKEIGNRLLKLRKKFHLTQLQMANMLNTSQSTISAYENGETLILTTFAYQI